VSNRKKSKMNLPPTREIILTDDNIEEVSHRTGYTEKALVDMLEKAKQQNYSGVRLSTLHE
jgi:hypothetical protein